MDLQVPAPPSLVTRKAHSEAGLVGTRTPCQTVALELFRERHVQSERQRACTRGMEPSGLPSLPELPSSSPSLAALGALVLRRSREGFTCCCCCCCCSSPRFLLLSRGSAPAARGLRGAESAQEAAQRECGLERRPAASSPVGRKLAAVWRPDRRGLSLLPLKCPRWAPGEATQQQQQARFQVAGRYSPSGSSDTRRSFSFPGCCWGGISLSEEYKL